MLMLLASLAVEALPEPAAPPSTIRVVGHGVARTPPDLAIIAMTVRGEGTSSDDAVRALAARREAVEAALAGKAEVRTGKLAVLTARDKACDGADDDEDKPRLSTGACAVRGYVATLRLTARVTTPAEAGTLLGLAGRLGATDPTLDEFGLRNPTTAQRAAVADAIRDARAQADAIAAASQVRLGRLRRVEDERARELAAQDIVVTGQRRQPPPEVAAPVLVRLSPEPIETDATLVVEFEVSGAGA